jgi:hypothetical protein
MTLSQSSSDHQLNSENIQAAMRRAIQDEVLEELADCLGVELCNIFTVISGMLQLRIMESGGAAADCRWTQSALDTASRGALLVNGLISCVAPQVWLPRCIDLDAFITGQLPTVNKVIGAAADFPTCDGRHQWKVLACPVTLASILQKLAENARHTRRDGDQFQIIVRNVAGVAAGAAGAPHGPVAGRDFVLMSVTFGRLALTEIEIVNVLKPVFLIKARGDATLNLHDGYASIRRSGGELNVENSAVGLRVNIWLPRAKWLSAEWFTQPEE